MGTHVCLSPPALRPKRGYGRHDTHMPLWRFPLRAFTRVAATRVAWMNANASLLRADPGRREGVVWRHATRGLMPRSGACLVVVGVR